MPRPTRALVPLLLVTLLACSGDPVPAGKAASPTSTPRREAAQPAVPGAPLATMQAGTSSIEGALVRWCAKGECRAPQRGPAGHVWLTDDRLLLFELSAAPARARLEIAREGDPDAPVTSRRLRAGDVMATHAGLARGRYLLSLIASWPEREAIWRFALRVPALEG